MNLSRVNFLLGNRGGPHYTLPVSSEFGAGHMLESGLNFEELTFLCKLVQEVNERLENILLSSGKRRFGIDLIGLLSLVSDCEESISCYRTECIGGEIQNSTGKISVADIPNSILVFAFQFFEKS